MLDTKKAIIILFLITAASFLPAISADFVNWDDDAHILQNPLVIQFTPRDIPKVFLEPNSANKTYIPLTTLSWATEYYLFGKSPLVFHLSNLVLHLAVVAVVFFLAFRFGVGPWGAFATALVFAIHPSRVENVAWVTARKDLLYGLFYLLAIGAYLTYLERLAKKPAAKQELLPPYLAALAFGLLSILSKAMALSLPWVLLLVDWIKGRRFKPAMLVDKIPFFLVIEPIAWITYAQNTREILLNFPSGFLVWFWSAAFYIHKFLWPGAMSPVYALPEPITLANPPYWMAFVVLAVTAAALWKWSNNRWLVFALSFYFLSSFFLWRFDSRDISVVADRFLYVPSFAACLGIGFVVEHYLKKKGTLRRVAIGTFAAVALAFATMTFMYSFAWRDGFALWSATAENSPDLAFAYNNRGALYVQKKQPEKAMADFTHAIELASKQRVVKDGKTLLPRKAAVQYASAHDHMGKLFAANKDYETALKHFNLAIYYDLEKADYFNNRAATLVKLGKMEEALSDYNSALSLDEKSYEATVNRGMFYYKRGDKKKALEDFETAIALKPALPEGYIQAGRIYFEEHRLADAKKVFESALKIEPENAQVLYNLGAIYSNMGEKQKAKNFFTQAQLKWLNDPEKYPLPGLDAKDAKFWAERLGK
jgi:tetratricopeptide (TPR) repeat protein